MAENVVAEKITVTNEHVNALQNGTATIDTVIEMGGVVDLEEQIAQLSLEKNQEYFQRRTELEQKIQDLTDLNDQEGLEMAKATLQTVEIEIAKRSENVGLILSQIAQKLTYFKDLGTKLLEDSPEDIAQREKAKKAVEDLIAEIAKAKSDRDDAEAEKVEVEGKKTPVETELGEAESSWKFWSRKDRIAAAKKDLNSINSTIRTNQRLIDAAPELIADLEEELAQARENIISAEEQIKVDKEHRIQTLSLDSLYATLTEWESKVFAIIEKDITDNQECISNSETALTEARNFGISETRRLKETEGDIAKLEGELEEKEGLLKNILDHESEEYFTARADAKDCAMQLDELGKKATIIRGNLAKAEIKIEEREAALLAMKADLQLQQRNYNDFAMDAEAARDVGRAIAQVIKNQAGKSMGDSLSRSRDAMTLTVVDVSLQSATATVENLAGRAERSVTLLDKIKSKQSEGAEEIARHNVRIAKAEEDYRSQYGDDEVFSGTKEEVGDSDKKVQDEAPKKNQGKKALF